MDLTLLRTLRTVAGSGSFHRAAELLHLTQPAVTKQIQALEHAVGERLLDRGRPVRLTPAGEVLVRYAEQIAGLVRSAEDELGDLRETGSGGRVAIGASHSVADFLPSLLAMSRARYPGLTLTVEGGWPDEIVRRVLDRELDIGLVVLTEPHDARPDGLATVPLLETELVFVAPADGSVLKGRRATLAELAHVPWILNHRSCAYRRLLQHLLAEQGRGPVAAVDGVNLDLQCRLVELGLGMALIPRSFLLDQGRRRKLRIVRIPGVKARSIIGLAYREDKYFHAPLRGLIGIVQEMFPGAPLGPLTEQRSGLSPGGRRPRRTTQMRITGPDRI